MKNPSGRTDSASRVIKAPPEKIYQAFLDPKAVAAWRPPEGMTCRVYTFEPFEGGTYKMAFEYEDADIKGKTAGNADVFQGRFLKLEPGEQIVEAVDFESEDPAFAGTMTLTTILLPVPGGTEVTFIAEDVPSGIKPEDHQLGMASSLENLAGFTE